jgi:hypothetical protein
MSELYENVKWSKEFSINKGWGYDGSTSMQICKAPCSESSTDAAFRVSFSKIAQNTYIEAETQIAQTQVLKSN